VENERPQSKIVRGTLEEQEREREREPARQQKKPAYREWTVLTIEERGGRAKMNLENEKGGSKTRKRAWKKGRSRSECETVGRKQHNWVHAKKGRFDDTIGRSVKGR
jgi:hypothetical protein